MRRLFAFLARLWPYRLRSRPQPLRQDSLTAVEYEAVTLIAYEGRKAHARACEQARYCRSMGSEDGFRFWSAVSAEVNLRTKGHAPEKR